MVEGAEPGVVVTEEFSDVVAGGEAASLTLMTLLLLLLLLDDDDDSRMHACVYVSMYACQRARTHVCACVCA